MILQLNPPLPVFVVGRGAGVAHLVNDRGPEHHLEWTVFMDDTGESWTVANPLVRGQWNFTMGRRPNDEGVRGPSSTTSE